ncbi:MAG TPA: hypothetical protein VFG04_02940 [Planctomycetaceae bacterium]|jgi:hypothetical protein|nr:hypothetical protein [Planctomycetaceae bacterium]
MISSNRLSRIQRIERIDPFDPTPEKLFKRASEPDPDDNSDDDYGGSLEFFEDCMRGLLACMREQREIIKALDREGQQHLNDLAEHLRIDRGIDRSRP